MKYYNKNINSTHIDVDKVLNNILKTQEGRDFVLAGGKGYDIKLLAPTNYMYKWSGASGLEGKKQIAQTINSFAPLLDEQFPKEAELLKAQELYSMLPENIPTNPEDRLQWLNVDGNYSLLLKEKSKWLLNQIHNSDTPVIKRLKQIATELENTEIVNAEVKDMATRLERLYPGATREEINAKANFAVNTDLTFDQIDIFASDGYGVFGVTKPTHYTRASRYKY